MSNAGPRRLLQLDILRGVAIGLVVLHHDPFGQAGALQPVSAYWRSAFWIGVELFFVLSGFLIGGLLFTEMRERGALDIRRFLIRRGFKIWPSYFAYLLAVLVVLCFHNHLSIETALKRLGPNLLHLQNYLGTCRGHTWSLAVEEHFYVVLPLFLAVLARWHGGTPRWLAGLPPCALVVSTFCIIARVISREQGLVTPDGIYHATHLRIDSLFFGVFLAYLSQFHPRTIERVARSRSALWVVGLALLIPANVFEPRSYVVQTVGYTFCYLGFGALLILTIHTPLGVGPLGRAMGSWVGRGLAAMGAYSYSTYLWHIDVSQGLIRALPQDPGGWLPIEVWWFIGTSVYLATAVGVGYLACVAVEKPLLLLRDRLFPSRARSVALTEEAEGDQAR